MKTGRTDQEETMADITMCLDHDCPRKDSCYRFIAPENPYRQSYFQKSPRKGDEACDMYRECPKMSNAISRTKRIIDNIGIQILIGAISEEEGQTLIQRLQDSCPHNRTTTKVNDAVVCDICEKVLLRGIPTAPGGS
jgi:hypothetical protein